jgi:hypothetical protein
MDTHATTMTIADYCAAMGRREIVVNRNYQRSDQVWPPAARSFLIETILLGLPIPKFWLHQITDVRTRMTKKEIVDGQQRSRAIFDFYNGDLRLSSTLELEDAAGRIYAELPEELQQRFVDYGLSIDLFVGATVDDVREVFRRMNSYTIPLNPEEQRHASNQGPFKWFVFRLTRDYSDAFVQMGTFGEKQLVRMADAKLLTEVANALIHGISTTSKASLDRLYKSRDVAFPEEDEFEHRFRSGLDFVLELQELHRTELMKSYVVYSLLLAVMHMQNPVASIAPVVADIQPEGLDRQQMLANLSALAAALDADETDLERQESPFLDFVRASSERTNVGSQRERRVMWLYRALVESLPV